MLLSVGLKQRSYIMCSMLAGHLRSKRSVDYLAADTSAPKRPRVEPIHPVNTLAFAAPQ